MIYGVDDYVFDDIDSDVADSHQDSASQPFSLDSTYQPYHFPDVIYENDIDEPIQNQSNQYQSVRLTPEEKRAMREQMEIESKKDELQDKTSLYDLLFRLYSNWFERSKIDHSTLSEMEFYFKSYRTRLAKDDILSNSLVTYLRTTYPKLHPYSEWLDLWAITLVVLLSLFVPKYILLVINVVYFYFIGMPHLSLVVVLMKFLLAGLFKPSQPQECQNLSLITVLVITVVVMVCLVCEVFGGAWMIVALMVLMIIYMIIYAPTLVQKSPVAVAQYVSLFLLFIVVIYFATTPPAVMWLQVQFPFAEVAKEKVRIQKFYNTRFERWLDDHFSNPHETPQYQFPIQNLDQIKVPYTTYDFRNIPSFLWSIIMLLVTHLVLKCVTQATSNCNAKTADQVIQVHTKKEDRIVVSFDMFLAIFGYPWYLWAALFDISIQMSCELSILTVFGLNVLTMCIAAPISDHCMQFTYIKIYERASKSLVASEKLQNKTISYGYFPSSEENHQSLRYYNAVYLSGLFFITVMPRLSQGQCVLSAVITVLATVLYVLYSQDKAHRSAQKYFALALLIATNSWTAFAIAVFYFWKFGTFVPFQDDIRPSGIPTQVSD